MRPLGALLLILVTPAIATSQQQIQFCGRTWTVSGEDVKVEDYLGQEAVRLRNSGLVLPDVEFENGTIEFDVATTGHRSFIGAAFRIDMATGAYEDFYLRPHNSGRDDATQYTPVYGVLSAWQLYPEYNAPIEIPTERWLHVKLVISGSHLEAFVADAGEPVLVVDDLKTGKHRGVVALKSNFPAAGQPADLYPTAFANFRLTLDESPGTYKEAAAPAPEVISRWALSPAFPAPETPIRALPSEMMESEGWETVVGESSGLVNLARYRGFPQDARRATVLARVIINSDRDQEKKLDFGFSDEGSIFLNGRCLLSANNTYRSRSFRYLGAVTIDNDAVYLPLRRGANELVIAVTEAFGGWGLIARLEDLDGISVEPASP
jgi:hypothetical protein